MSRLGSLPLPSSALLRSHSCRSSTRQPMIWLSFSRPPSRPNSLVRYLQRKYFYRMPQKYFYRISISTFWKYLMMNVTMFLRQSAIICRSGELGIYITSGGNGLEKSLKFPSRFSLSSPQSVSFTNTNFISKCKMLKMIFNSPYKTVLDVVVQAKSLLVE